MFLAADSTKCFEIWFYLINLINGIYLNSIGTGAQTDYYGDSTKQSTGEHPEYRQAQAHNYPAIAPALTNSTPIQYDLA